jgi:hypothetical protein
MRNGTIQSNARRSYAAEATPPIRAIEDRACSRRSTHVLALRGASRVIREYESDSSSKRPLSSVVFAAGPAPPGVRQRKRTSRVVTGLDRSLHMRTVPEARGQRSERRRHRVHRAHATTKLVVRVGDGSGMASPWLRARHLVKRASRPAPTSPTRHRGRPPSFGLAKLGCAAGGHAPRSAAQRAPARSVSTGGGRQRASDLAHAHRPDG